MKFSKEEKAMWLEDWRRSGKSAWTYAKENGIVPQTFVHWTKAGVEANPGFVEVPARIMTPPQRTAEILIEKGEIKIHMPLEAGYDGLRAVIKGLGAAL
jgi:hypothetical protein